MIRDTIYHPAEKAPGIVGNPYYCGTDIIWDVVPADKKETLYKGYVADPREGKIYNAELWREGSDLVLRGKILFFGRNDLWPAFPSHGFTKDFPKPDVSKFVPVIPKVTN